MAPTDSLFMVEIIVEELTSFVKCRDFIIKSQFADVFSITLKDPNELNKDLPKLLTKKPTKRKKIGLYPSTTPSLVPKVQKGQTVLFSGNIENLISNMTKYPMELSLWSKVYPELKLASTIIPWNACYIDYLNMLHTEVPKPISMKGEYNVFDEFTSRRMAAIKLNVKLSYFSDTDIEQFKSLSKETPDSCLNASFNSKPSTVLSTVQKKPLILSDEPGLIKTIYSGGKKINKSRARKEEKTRISKLQSDQIRVTTIENRAKNKKDSTILTLVKSDTVSAQYKQIDMIKRKSCSSLQRERLNILNYIFGEFARPCTNQVFCVNYCTIKNDNLNTPDQSSKGSPKTTKSSPQASNKNSPGLSKSSPQLSSRQSAQIFHKDDTKFTFKPCHDECVNKIDFINLSEYSLDLPKGVSSFTKIDTCKQVTCFHKKWRELPPPPDDRILLDLTNLKRDCCDHLKSEKENVVEKLEEVSGEMKAKMKISESDPCYCECECRFGFTKKTIYCKICRGYENIGDEYAKIRANEMPFPCPIYHKMTDKPKMKPLGAVGSDTKKGSKNKSLTDKSIESEKETKKSKKKKKEDKFKFNYGYTAPRIGHSHCAFPCTGTMGLVPKNMGWLWTAESGGLKFRPMWKPGAVNKHVLRLLKIAKNPEEAFAKKRKKITDKGKRPLKRPLLIVHKKDGEYTVTMETMKTYAKPRAFNQVPYEDKAPITYTIGRTDEENYIRRKKKERTRRRLERAQREFIQSAFRDMCQEICLKTYQQALGILPDTEKPDCTCYPAEPGPDRTDLDRSCSCSEDSKHSESDTDSDEWVVEFTPPSATYYSNYKTTKVICVDATTQYTYLDYRVKLLDRYGNPIPRFFKGPDGKEQCSDLGGFWDPNHKWLDINIDGYIAPDGKWAPNNFLGPNDEQVDAEIGKFQAMDGAWLVVGIDGYVDANRKWRFYTNATTKAKEKLTSGSKKGVTKRKEHYGKHVVGKESGTWSCFGDASAKYLSEMGIMGHGHDRKLLLDTLKQLIAQGENIKTPKYPSMPRSPLSKKRKERRKILDERKKKCSHATPSNKGIVAIDGQGNKTYFKFTNYENKRPKERLHNLSNQGISVSSFHMPCFHSFISSEIMKKQLYERRKARAKEHAVYAKDRKKKETKIRYHF